MSNPLIGQLQPFGFNWAPHGWIGCFGQLLSISQSQALYSLVGDRYGGDGRSTFGIPDLRGRRPIGSGQGPATNNYPWGARGGVEQVGLSTDHLPAHSHPLSSATPPPIDATTVMTESSLTSTAVVKANGSGVTGYVPTGQYPGANVAADIYNANADNATMANDMVTVTTTLDSVTLSTTGTVDLTGVSTGNTGAGEAFSVLSPYTAIGCYAINENGTYPSRN